MTKLQWAVVISAIMLVFVLYFGCDRVSSRQKDLEKTRLLNAQSTDLNALLITAKPTLAAENANTVLALERQLEAAGTESDRTEILKQLSGKWFEFGHPAIAGAYARQVAEIEGSEDSWAIAGTTFAIGLQRDAEAKVQAFCLDQAVQCFENAISINPDNLDHKVNLALCYVESNEPMKGIQMLTTLNQQFPDNVLVLNTLGRLAIRSGQFERALTRLEKAASLEPGNVNTVCLLAQAYEGAGQNDKARQMAEKCTAMQ